MNLLTIITNTGAANGARAVSDSADPRVAYVYMITCAILLCLIIYDLIDKCFSKDRW